jgi:hypothetical protein
MKLKCGCLEANDGLSDSSRLASFILMSTIVAVGAYHPKEVICRAIKQETATEVSEIKDRQ